MDNWIEWLGYAASVVVAVSLMMTNIRRLRWINMSGAVLFTLYGALLQVYPVLFVNAFIVGVNIYQLLRVKLTRDHFHLIPISWDTSIFLPRFLEFYLPDIHIHFPGVKIEDLRQYRTIFITRNVVPVGLFIYEHKEEGIIQIHLDYEIPTYRDFESARFFFREFRNMMQDKGFHTYITYCSTPIHRRYLLKMNFVEDVSSPGLYVRRI